MCITSECRNISKFLVFRFIFVDTLINYVHTKRNILAPVVRYQSDQ
jgi:hypothetical protein